jgi:hypothetical protein
MDIGTKSKVAINCSEGWTCFYEDYDLPTDTNPETVSVRVYGKDDAGNDITFQKGVEP